MTLFLYTKLTTETKTTFFLINYTQLQKYKNNNEAQNIKFLKH